MVGGWEGSWPAGELWGAGQKCVQQLASAARQGGWPCAATRHLAQAFARTKWRTASRGASSEATGMRPCAGPPSPSSSMCSLQASQNTEHEGGPIAQPACTYQSHPPGQSSFPRRHPPHAPLLQPSSTITLRRWAQAPVQAHGLGFRVGLPKPKICMGAGASAGPRAGAGAPPALTSAARAA